MKTSKKLPSSENVKEILNVVETEISGIGSIFELSDLVRQIELRGKIYRYIVDLLIEDEDKQS